MQTHNYTSKCFYEHTHATSTYISLLRSSGMKCIVKPCTNTYARSTHNSVRSKWSICDANVRNKDDVKITMLRTPKWIERCSMNGISIETNTHLSACRWDFYVPLKNCCSCMCVHVYVGLIALSLLIVCVALSRSHHRAELVNLSHIASVVYQSNKFSGKSSSLFSFLRSVLFLWYCLPLFLYLSDCLVLYVHLYLLRTHTNIRITHTQRGIEFVYSTNRKTATDKEAHLNLILIIDNSPKNFRFQSMEFTT